MPRQLLGYPLPKFPQSLLESTKSGMDFLKQPSSVHAYAAVEEKLAAKDKDTPSDKAKGYLQRQYKKFVDDYDKDHDWAGLSRIILGEGISIWCCQRCCRVIEENPDASFAELREKTGCPISLPEGSGGSGDGGSAAVDIDTAAVAAQNEAERMRLKEENALLKAQLEQSRPLSEVASSHSTDVAMDGGIKQVLQLMADFREEQKAANQSLREEHKAANQSLREEHKAANQSLTSAIEGIGGNVNTSTEDEDDAWWAPKAPKTGADALRPSGAVLHRGRMEKRGGGTSMFGRRNWKERYFMLYENILVYFASESDAAAADAGKRLGELPLMGCTVQFNYEQRQFVLCFPSGRIFEMRCADDAAFRTWKEQLVSLAALKLLSP